MGIAQTPSLETWQALHEAAHTGQTVTVCLAGLPGITGTVMHNPYDPDAFQVVEVGTSWVSPSFYPETVSQVVWE